MVVNFLPHWSGRRLSLDTKCYIDTSGHEGWGVYHIGQAGGSKITGYHEQHKLTTT